MAKKKNPAAVALGRKGGKARAKLLSKAELSRIGKLGGRPKVTETSSKRHQNVTKMVEKRK